MYKKWLPNLDAIMFNVGSNQCYCVTPSVQKVASI